MIAMKRVIPFVLVLTLVTALTGCFRQDEFDIRIVVPAGYSGIAYADEEISPLDDEIEISTGKGLGDTMVELKPVEVKEKTAYEGGYLTPGMPVEIEVEKGAWFKIGVMVDNPTDEEKEVFVHVEDIEVRVE